MAKVIHTIGGKKYLYEHHREGKKVVCDYIGPTGEAGELRKSEKSVDTQHEGDKGDVSPSMIMSRQMNRKQAAQKIDEGKLAQKHTPMEDAAGRDRWNKAPNRNDIIGIDTPKDLAPPPGFVAPPPGIKTSKKPKHPIITPPIKPDDTQHKTSIESFKVDGYQFGEGNRDRLIGVVSATQENFTQQEQDVIKKNCVIVENHRPGSAAYFIYNRYGTSEIGLSPNTRKEAAEASMTHEWIHALRFIESGYGEEWKERKGKYTAGLDWDKVVSRGRASESDKEEAQTTAETTTRFPFNKFDTESMRGHPSYYANIQDPSFDTNRWDDKILMTGNPNDKDGTQHKIGKDAIDTTEEKYPKSHIARMARQGIKGKAENIDTTFRIADMNGKTVGFGVVSDDTNKITPQGAARLIRKPGQRIFQIDDKGSETELKTRKKADI